MGVTSKGNGYIWEAYKQRKGDRWLAKSKLKTSPSLVH